MVDGNMACSIFNLPSSTVVFSYLNILGSFPIQGNLEAEPSDHLLGFKFPELNSSDRFSIFSQDCPVDLGSRPELNTGVF